MLVLYVRSSCIFIYDEMFRNPPVSVLLVSIPSFTKEMTEGWIHWTVAQLVFKCLAVLVQTRIVNSPLNIVDGDFDWSFVCFAVPVVWMHWRSKRWRRCWRRHNWRKLDSLSPEWVVAYSQYSHNIHLSWLSVMSNNRCPLLARRNERLRPVNSC